MKSYALQLTDDNDLNPATEVLDLKVEVVRGANRLITQGLVLGNATPQHQTLILTAYQGEFKEYPELGVGLGDALFTADLLPLRHSIRRQLAMDGMRVNELKLNRSGEFYLDAGYEE